MASILLKQNTAAGGTDTTTVTTGNSNALSGDAFDTVNGTGFTFSSLQALSDTLSYLTTTPTDYLAYEGIDTVLNWKVKFAFYAPDISVTTTLMRVLQLHPALYFKVEFVQTDEVFRFGNGSSNFGVSTTPITVNTWFQFEITGDADAGTVVIVIKDAAGVVLETLEYTDTIPALDSVQFGPSLVGVGGYYDSFAVYNENYVSPVTVYSFMQPVTFETGYQNAPESSKAYQHSGQVLVHTDDTEIVYIPDNITQINATVHTIFGSGKLQYSASTIEDLAAGNGIFFDITGGTAVVDTLFTLPLGTSAIKLSNLTGTVQLLVRAQ